MDKYNKQAYMAGRCGFYHLPQGRDRLWALVQMVMNLSVP
jgi:hypothetical protein